MKHRKPFNPGFYFLLLLTLVFQSCIHTPGIWQNDKIDPAVRADFDTRTRELIGYIKAGQVKKVKVLLSKEFSSDNETEPLIEHVGNRLNDNKYHLVNQYYIVTKSPGIITIKTDAGTDHYQLNFQTTEREMYIAVYLPACGLNQYMISIIYSKLDYGWKVTSLEAEPYTLNGKTAPELLKMAAAADQKGYLTDAVNTGGLAVKCLKPASVWQYQIEDSLHSFYSHVIARANQEFKFPYTLTEISTRPQIIRVLMQTDERGSFPMVHYLTSIRLTDTVALKNENARIRKVITKLMPGLDKDKKYVFYSAFNERPSALREVDRYEMTDKLE